MEEFWTPSFLRLISNSEDDKKLRIFRKLILHRWGDNYINKPNDSDTKNKENLEESMLFSQDFDVETVEEHINDTGCTDPTKSTLSEENPLDSPVLSHKSASVSNLDELLISANTPDNVNNLNENPKDTIVKVKIIIPKGIMSKEARENAKEIIKYNVLSTINAISKAKHNKNVKNQQNDSEVVKNLVMSKYSDLLNQVYRRRFDRILARREALIRDILIDYCKEREYDVFGNVSSNSLKNYETNSIASTQF